jgi:hypothetical protein
MHTGIMIIPSLCAIAVAVSLSADAPPAPLRQELVLLPPAVTVTVVAAPVVRALRARPSVLVPLYVGFATLQGMDYHSTSRALAGGAGREANPMMRKIVGNRPAFIAVKAATSAGVILVGERLWKKNRVGAVVFMAIANGAMAAVVARNYSVR